MPPTAERGGRARRGVRLVGELTRPSGSDGVPAALRLSGSGPLDCDSNMPGQVLDISLARSRRRWPPRCRLAAYDKRGVGESGGDYLRTGFHEETDDAHAV